MGLEDNLQRQADERIQVNDDRLKVALHEFKDELLDTIEKKFATKKDVRWLVITALLGGPMTASLLTAAITRQTPPEQIESLGRLITSLL